MWGRKKGSASAPSTGENLGVIGWPITTGKVTNRVPRAPSSVSFYLLSLLTVFIRLYNLLL